jgi:three-Cys-motif partner protein
VPDDVSRFFESPQAAAKLKHEILKRYLRVFVQKVGSRSRDHQVGYLDGYAGPGQYGDTSPGSPAIAVEVAETVGHIDQVVGHLVEKESSSCAALREFIEQRQPTWSVYEGNVEEHLDSILSATAGLPLFAFLDPFGLGLPLDTLTSQVLQRPAVVRGRRCPTEVLLNFSLSGLRRNAGHLDSTSGNARYLTARQTILERLDKAMGGGWWRSIWQTHESTEREDAIFEGFLERLSSSASGWSLFALPVSDRWQGRADYHLVLLTRHRDGIYFFNESVSLALEKYREFCLAEAGQLDLEPLKSKAPDWIATIEENVKQLLTRGPFVVKDHVAEVYGSTLGFAREMHVRKAIKNLHTAGVTPTTGVGNVAAMRVVRASS